MFQAIAWQRAEGAVLFAAGLAILASQTTGLPWWAALLLFFAPDLAFFGYLLGARIGAALYNLVHIHGFGAAVIGLGLLRADPLLVALGGLWLGHSGFDRMLGYGLKSPEGFGLTHLGRIGSGRR